MVRLCHKIIQIGLITLCLLFLFSTSVVTGREALLALVFVALLFWFVRGRREGKSFPDLRPLVALIFVFIAVQTREMFLPWSSGIILVLITAWVIELAAKRDFQVIKSPLDLAVLLTAVYLWLFSGGVQILLRGEQLSEGVRGGAKGNWQIWLYLGLYFIIKGEEKEKQQRWMGRAALAVLMVSSVISGYRMVNLISHYNRANSYKDSQELDKALHEYNKVREMNSVCRLASITERIYFGLAPVYAEKKMYDKAILAYEETFRLKPDDTNIREQLARVYLDYGNVLLEKGLSGEAIVSYKAYRRLVLDNSQVEKKLSQAYQSYPFIRDWLLCGPFDNTDGKGLITDFIGETDVLPVAGLNSGGKEWFKYRSPANKVYLDSLFNPNDYVVAYAFCYLYSPRDQSIELWLGTDDGGQVLLNGKVVYNNPVDRNLFFDQERIDIQLKRGWNKLLVKIEEKRGLWGLAVRLSREDGSPVEGLKYSLEPPKFRKGMRGSG